MIRVTRGLTWKFPSQFEIPFQETQKGGNLERTGERERGSAIDRRRPSGMASGFTTPPPSGQGRGQRSTGRKRKTTQRKSAVKQAKTPLSTLLKKASENRVLRDAKLVSMANRKCVSCFSLVSNARTDDFFRIHSCPTFCRSSSGSARLQTSWRALASSRP